jgi:hypothetical protein
MIVLSYSMTVSVPRRSETKSETVEIDLKVVRNIRRVPGVPGSHRLSDPTLTTALHDTHRPTIRLSIYASCHELFVGEYTPC